MLPKDKKIDHATYTMQLFAESIGEHYGITLRWAELAALRQYAQMLHSSPWRAFEDVESQFMRDYFGFDHPALGKHSEQDGSWRPTGRYLGMRLLGTPEFKEYCRRNVEHWRAERELI